MNHKLNKLGLALVAVIAIGALSGSAASAASYTSVNGNYSTSVTGNQSGSFEFKAGIRTITCASAHLEGTMSAASSTLTLVPLYSGGCTANSGLPVTVTLNDISNNHNCDYLLHATSSTASTTDIVCEAGDVIHYDIFASAAAHSKGEKPVCEIHVTPQTGVTGVATSNIGSGTTATVEATLNLTVSLTILGSPLVCGTGTTGTYKGVFPLAATFGGKSEGIHVK